LRATQSSQVAERFLCPKDISSELERIHGLIVSADYIRSVRSETIRRGAGIFVAGDARVSDVFAWLRANPKFRAFKRRDISVAV
jgi:hypothetical protein